MALTEDDIIGSLQSGLGLSRSESSRYLDTVLELIKSFLADGDDVVISGFGKFMVKPKAARRGRNPATGGRLTLRRRKVVTFRCSAVLREKIDGTPPRHVQVGRAKKGRARSVRRHMGVLRTSA